LISRLLKAKKTKKNKKKNREEQEKEDREWGWGETTGIPLNFHIVYFGDFFNAISLTVLINPDIIHSSFDTFYYSREDAIPRCQMTN